MGNQPTKKTVYLYETCNRLKRVGSIRQPKKLVRNYGLGRAEYVTVAGLAVKDEENRYLSIVVKIKATDVDLTQTKVFEPYRIVDAFYTAMKDEEVAMVQGTSGLNFVVKFADNIVSRPELVVTIPSTVTTNRKLFTAALGCELEKMRKVFQQGLPNLATELGLTGELLFIEPLYTKDNFVLL